MQCAFPYDDHLYYNVECLYVCYWIKGQRSIENGSQMCGTEWVGGFQLVDVGIDVVTRRNPNPFTYTHAEPTPLILTCRLML